MKIFFGILILFLTICATSAFWLDYFALQRERIKELKKENKKMDEQICRQYQEMNQLAKQRNAWVIEANRLKGKCQ